MKRQRVPAALGRRVRKQARCRCGYCLSSAVLTGMPMSFDHLIPQALGGQTVEENLWQACRRCNEFKGILTHALDPLTKRQCALFNPRQQRWHEHFKWNEEGTTIIGKTPCGRATVLALHLNNAEIVMARRLWVSVGWWPPED